MFTCKFEIFIYLALTLTRPCQLNHLKDDVSRAGKISVKVLPGTLHTILRKSVQWIEADIACQMKLGTHLTVLPTLDSAKALAEAIKDISVWNATKSDYFTAEQKYEFGLDRRYWIGLSDSSIVEGSWVWLTGDNTTRKLDYSFWYPHQPDHILKPSNPKEHCVVLWNPTFYKGDLHSFNDEACNKKYYAICESKPS